MEYPISKREYDDIRTLLYDESGIALGESKQSLVVSRLSKRLRDLRLDSFAAYYAVVTEDSTGGEFTRMLDMLSTNKTDFFREPKHFEFLRDVILPDLEREKRISIWSSACSTGEEPYTIAMTLRESVRQPSPWEFRILASDISTRVLAHAAQGLYAVERIRTVPPDVAKRHFLRGRGAQAGLVKVKPHLTEMIKFRRMNLMDEHFPIKTRLDLIFCRNVMIYFDRPTQERLVNKFYGLLKPGGHLFIGHSESLQWLKHPFTSVAPTIYRKDD
ncbi:MAG: protein-glutamate O-methyltransferase [Nitrospira sp.]|nr:protein-glutamate O-methyltransferase [Nitrospira sp.]